MVWQLPLIIRTCQEDQFRVGHSLQGTGNPSPWVEGLEREPNSLYERPVMAENHLNPGLPSLNECLFFAQERGKPIGLIVIGGVAMELYGLPRGTLDIDAEISCDPDFYGDLVHHLKEKGILFNIGDDIDHWGQVPLPAGYRDRAQTILSTDIATVKVLDPLDFIASKLRRGTDQDLEDALKVARHFSLSETDVERHMTMIRFPLSEETFFFKKRLESFLETLGRGNTSNSSATLGLGDP